MNTGIFFDLDGTLWDSAEKVVKSWNETFISEGYDFQITVEDMQSCMGKLMTEIADILMSEVEPEHRYELLKKCEINENELLRREGGILFDNVEKMLKLMSEKYKLFIVSNCQQGYIEAFLDFYGFGDYITDTENPGVTGLSKGENIKLVARRNDIDKIIYIGDTLGDYNATMEAGGTFIHAAYGFGEVDNVTKVYSVMEIPKAVNMLTYKRELFLPEEILLKIDKPARYIGNEYNMVVKNPYSVDVRFCMCFPDLYEIGMSHLGIQIIYDMLNSWEDVYCERLYSPWTDLDAVLREEKIPLFAIESQQPVKNFDFLGITLQYEMCYTNILQILELSKIPLYSEERTEDDPIVIGGGPCVYNAEPIADFFDLFYIGEGESKYRELIDLYKENKKNGGSRKDFLLKAASISCIYVPSLYDIEYNEDGTVKSIIPKNDKVPSKVKKDIVLNLSDTCYPEKPLVPFWGNQWFRFGRYPPDHTRLTTLL